MNSGASSSDLNSIVSHSVVQRHPAPICIDDLACSRQGHTAQRIPAEFNAVGPAVRTYAQRPSRRQQPGSKAGRHTIAQLPSHMLSLYWQQARPSLTCDVGGVLRGQEGRDLADLIGLPNPLQWGARKDPASARNRQQAGCGMHRPCCFASGSKPMHVSHADAMVRAPAHRCLVAGHACQHIRVDGACARRRVKIEPWTAP